MKRNWDCKALQAIDIYSGSVHSSRAASKKKRNCKRHPHQRDRRVRQHELQADRAGEPLVHALRLPGVPGQLAQGDPGQCERNQHVNGRMHERRQCRRASRSSANAFHRALPLIEDHPQCLQGWRSGARVDLTFAATSAAARLSCPRRTCPVLSWCLVAEPIVKHK